MRKIKLLLIIFIIFQSYISLLYSDDVNKNGKKDNSYFFYIPSQEDINDFFNLFQYLIKWDKNEINITDKQISKYYEDYVNQNSFQGLLFESFLLQTQNKKIQKHILNLIKENNFKDSFSQTLYRKYNSKKKEFKQDNKNQIQFNYEERYYDENINLFYMSQSLTFNKKLGLMLFENNWANISFNDPNKDKNIDSFFLIYGGGTNSMTIHLYEYSNISFKEFNEIEIKKKYTSDKYKKWKIQELLAEGILERAGADKIYIGLGTGPDIIPEIDNATFCIYLYNKKLKTGYALRYFMNFSKINNNYEIRHRIWNHLLMQLTLTFINKP